MKILVITANYPHITNEYNGIFVKNTLQELAICGNEIVVIAPQKLHKSKMPLFEQDGKIKIYRPTFISFGAKNIFGFNTKKLSQKSFENCAFKMAKNINFNPDVIYSHFLFPAGKSAITIGDFFGKRSFCVLGESDILAYEKFNSKNKLLNIYNKFEKLFPNTPEIKNILQNRYGLMESNIKLIPNGVDISKFYPMDKVECREKLGLSTKEKIVLFIGSFIERKGPLRVLEACRNLKEKPKMIFIGSGSQKPKDENVIFCEKVAHSKLVFYLNAADVYVLPTKNEGMPNIILEAMACNIPIVTSDIEVNQMILDGYPYRKLCKYDDIDCLADGIDNFLHLKQSQFDYLFEYTLTNRVKQINIEIQE